MGVRGKKRGEKLGIPQGGKGGDGKSKREYIILLGTHFLSVRTFIERVCSSLGELDRVRVEFDTKSCPGIGYFVWPKFSETPNQ